MKLWGRKGDEPAPHLELANTILRETREELVRADGKASILFAAVGVIIGAIVAAVLAGSWHPHDLDNNIEWLWWIGAAAGLLGATALGSAVFPRTTYRSQRRQGIVAYFGDVVGLSPEELKQGLIETAEDPGAAALDQVRAVSSIVDKKYKAIQVGITCIAVAGLCCITAVLVGG
jgi:MFS family permease